MSRGITTSVPRDANRVPVTYGVSSVDGLTPVPIEVNPSNGQLLVTSNLLNTNNTGTVTGTGTFVVNTTSASSLSFQVTGTWSGTITLEASLDGSNWISTSFVALASGNTSSNFSANTIGQINVTGLQNIRFRGLSVTGTANINTYLSQATSNIMLDNPLPQGTNVIGKVGIDQSTPGTSNAVQFTNTSITANAGTNLNTSALALDATLTNGNQQAKLTNGTNVADVINPTTVISEGNALLTAQTTKSYTFSYTAVTTGTTYDVGNFKSVSLQITSHYTTSTITPQISNDGTNWYTLNINNTGTTQYYPSGLTVTGIFAANITARYFRINVTGTYTSGTAAGVITFSTGTHAAATVNSLGVTFASTNLLGTITTSSSSVIGVGLGSYSGLIPVSINGTYAGVSFGITVSDNSGTNYYNVPVYDVVAGIWRAPGYTFTPGTNASALYYVQAPQNGTGTSVKVLASAYTSGTANVRIGGSGASTNLPLTMNQIWDSAGNNRGANVGAENGLYTSMQASASGAYTYSHISTSTTTTVKSGAGTLARITVNTLGTVASTCTVYDNTAGSGTIIAVINTLNLSGTFTYNVAFSTGLTIVTTGTVAPDITVSYK